MGIIYGEMAEYDQAVTCYRDAISLAPDRAESWTFLGNAQQKTGDLEGAEASLKHAIQLDQNYALAHYNIALLYERTNQVDLAEACYQRAISIQPDFVEAMNNLADLYLCSHQAEQAHPLILSALKINPNFSKAWFNLGGFYLESNQFKEAEKYYLRAFSLCQDISEDMVTSFLFNISHGLEHSAAELFDRHVELGHLIEQQVNSVYQHTKKERQDKRIHVGFLSGDIYTHALSRFLEPILLHLRKDDRFTLSVYATGFKKDAKTEVLKAYFHHFHDCKTMEDARLAELIYQDKVDILIDLSGHTAFSRLKVLAMKPAPIQASWLGYPGTSGMKAIDYYIGSYYFLPEGQFDNLFVEKLVRLPCSSPFLIDGDYPEVNELPSLHRKEFYFASFNRPNKISPYIVGVWARLMQQVEDSKLLLAHMHNNTIPAWLLAEFEKYGIGQDRLECLPKTHLYNYFSAHHKIDLCLDSYPYGGGTTSMHALWMGVPTLTLAGEYTASRHGATICGLFDLPEFIAYSDSEFISKGVYWSQHRQELNALRQGLRTAWQNNKRIQSDTVSHYFIQALLTMWGRYEQQLPPVAFTLQEEKSDA